jgi:hypothetical protein
MGLVPHVRARCPQKRLSSPFDGQGTAAVMMFIMVHCYSYDCFHGQGYMIVIAIAMIVSTVGAIWPIAQTVSQ